MPQTSTSAVAIQEKEAELWVMPESSLDFTDVMGDTVVFQVAGTAHKRWPPVEGTAG